MLGEEKLINFTNNNYQKKITKVNERIYHFLGYGHSNAIAIIGDSSVILIDTLDSNERAKIMNEELAKITDKPVKTIIYSHSHPDHLGGAGAFRNSVEEVIAFASQKPILKYYDRISDLLNQRGTFQHGHGLSDEEAISQGIGIREGKAVNEGEYDFIPPTTIYREKVVERIIDGVKIKMVSAVGESDDEIYIWLDDDKVMCCGDNYYGCWPNLYAIRGTAYRDVATWIDTLDEILSYPAIALLPGHTKVLWHEEIKEVVGNFRDAIEDVLFKTLDCMNQGMTIDQTVQQVKLAQKYQDKEYLGEYYGTVEWSVKSIYNGYVGWFDGNPVNLLPHSNQEYYQAILTLIGDNHKLLLAVKEYMEKDDYQMALQLLELLSGQDNSLEIMQLKKECLMQRAKQVTSANARHYLIASAKNL